MIGADQRVTPIEALKAMTINVAHQYGEQASKGSLEIGTLADLAIRDLNPLKVEPMKIKDVKVIETIKEGKAIYRSGGQAAQVRRLVMGTRWAALSRKWAKRRLDIRLVRAKPVVRRQARLAKGQ